MILSKDYITVKKSFDNFEIQIEFEKKNQDKSLIRLKLICDEKSIKKVRATLIRDEREICSFLLSNNKPSIFEDISFGHYILVFTKDSKKVGEYPFQLKESKGKE